MILRIDDVILAKPNKKGMNDTGSMPGFMNSLG